MAPDAPASTPSATTIGSVERSTRAWVVAVVVAPTSVYPKPMSTNAVGSVDASASAPSENACRAAGTPSSPSWSAIDQNR